MVFFPAFHASPMNGSRLVFAACGWRYKRFATPSICVVTQSVLDAFCANLTTFDLLHPLIRPVARVDPRIYIHIQRHISSFLLKCWVLPFFLCDSPLSWETMFFSVDDTAYVMYGQRFHVTLKTIFLRKCGLPTILFPSCSSQKKTDCGSLFNA